jgi:hypothetical protein
VLVRSRWTFQLLASICCKCSQPPLTHRHPTSSWPLLCSGPGPLDPPTPAKQQPPFPRAVKALLWTKSSPLLPRVSGPDTSPRLPAQVRVAGWQPGDTGPAFPSSLENLAGNVLVWETDSHPPPVVQPPTLSGLQSRPWWSPPAG